MSSPIKIHNFKLSGHAHRVLMFASIAGIDNEVIDVDLLNGEHKKEPFLSLNPAQQVPVIEDGDVVITDSNAILVYLARKYAPSFLPTDLALEAQVQKYLTMAAGEIAFGAGAARLITVFDADYDSESTQTLANQSLIKLEGDLAGRDYLVDNKISIADVAIYSYIFLAPEGGVSLAPYPNVRRFLGNVESQAGFVPMVETKAGLRT